MSAKNELWQPTPQSTIKKDAIVGYIYGLIDPRDSEIKYIGRTNDVNRRYAEHCENKIDSGGVEKCAWINILKSNNLFPIIVILEIVLSDSDISAKETWWISLAYRKGWKIRNSTYLPRNQIDFSEFSVKASSKQHYDSRWLNISIISLLVGFVLYYTMIVLEADIAISAVYGVSMTIATSISLTTNRSEIISSLIPLLFIILTGVSFA